MYVFLVTAELEWMLFEKALSFVKMSRRGFSLIHPIAQ
jgi:hypothetical protein